MSINTKLQSRRQAGFSLVEVIIFIVVVSVGVSALALMVANQVKLSPDPMLQRQSLAIAESLLEEIALQAFTPCDLSDPKYQDASFRPASGADCTGGAGGAYDVMKSPLGSQGTGMGRSRTSATNAFNQVADYNGLTLNGITGLDGIAVSGLSGYKATVTVSEASAEISVSANRALRIDVTVQDPRGQPLTLTAYRLMYAVTP